MIVNIKKFLTSTLSTILRSFTLISTLSTYLFDALGLFRPQKIGLPTGAQRILYSSGFIWTDSISIEHCGIFLSFMN